MGNWVVNHWLAVLCLVAWLGLNVFLFVHTFLKYEKDDKYYYTREILGTALAVARASAFCLNFNSMLILIPVCRNLLSFLRGSFCSRTLRKSLDHNLTFHKLVAYMICIFTAIHIIAHLFNFERYSRSHHVTTITLASVLSSLHHDKEGGFWLNPIASPDMTVLYVTFTTIAGLSGVIITIALILMVTSSMEFIRRHYFELFWYTHHLFIIYMVCLWIHGLGGIVRSQTEKSMNESHPHKCAQSFEKWDDHDPDCKEPQFEGHPPESWKWTLAPFALYIFERFLLRFYRSQQKVVITKVVMHPSKVLELQMKKRGFSMEVGQYIFVNCPSISFLEWHPFTLTSAPEEDFFSIHIRAAGDWTENLIRVFEQQNSLIPRIEVDGPFGTASEDVFQYEVAVLVGAGIGVTPFASILKSIWFKLQHSDHKLKTQKAGHVALNFDKATDILTGLKQKTFFGRPMWDNEFSTIATTHPKSVVGVFLCGPLTLAKSLRKCCHQYSSLDPRKVQFYFNQENF
ncbi:NADPH oxidase 1 isoform 2-T2 [Urocitellus parryii]|uniref:NADPH oxidase 1 n=1 Tax=Urocitellus parryii TaxID=9999 RepID=A0A8D2HGA5_UROPR